ncbi:hypothetical protein MMC22_004415 [Lobaria immixta]|nr:hypothetical protein [Lobaria immixta]
MPGDVENILSMEKFYPLLKSVNCSRDKMTLAFKNDKTFAYAQKVWDWVNGADDHAFVMVAGLGDCGWNRHRQPFIVTSIAYDEGLNTARLTAKPSDWRTVAHTYDLTVGHVPLTDSRLPARDFSKNLALGIATLFPFSVKIGTENGLSSALECSNCGTTGKIDFELKISTKLAVPTGASIIISPKGVSAKAELKLTESGELTESLPFEKEVLKLPLDSITIPGGIVNIGPNLVVSVGFEISSWEGTASISGGAIVTLPDSAILQLDLLNPSNNKFSGWTPNVSPIPIRVDAKISAGLEVYAKPALKLVAEAIHHGYEIGLDLKMPFLNAKFEPTVSKTAACDTNHEFGVQVSSNIGAKLTVEAAKVSSPEKPFLKLEIATVDFPLAEHCFAFGPLVGGGDSTNPPPGDGSTPPPPSGGGPPPSDSGSGATSCKTKSGLSGTCISTSTCSSGGGKSEAGHCPGAADIQCCTHSPKDESTGGSCKIKSGLKGTCISTSACSSGGGESEAGHCPGAADIQVYKQSNMSVPSLRTGSAAHTPRKMRALEVVAKSKVVSRAPASPPAPAPPAVVNPKLATAPELQTFSAAHTPRKMRALEVVAKSKVTSRAPASLLAPAPPAVVNPKLATAPELQISRYDIAPIFSLPYTSFTYQETSSPTP